VPSAVPYLGFAIEKMKKGELRRAMFLVKGSLFLGRMSQLSDGVSFLLEAQAKGKSIVRMEFMTKPFSDQEIRRVPYLRGLLRIL